MDKEPTEQIFRCNKKRKRKRDNIIKRNIRFMSFDNRQKD